MPFCDIREGCQKFTADPHGICYAAECFVNNRTLTPYGWLVLCLERHKAEFFTKETIADLYAGNLRATGSETVEKVPVFIKAYAKLRRAPGAATKEITRDALQTTTEPDNG